ncbi:unnamed protein product [Prorocentrum cordatum]|uniref:Uncharacterized protein n=1 Tax=Prorocentrum cordatum TaxID=2364126 RepID=A0ABN9WRC0_9DINO|nr:unnamed protein product [Polarella glacialis]
MALHKFLVMMTAAVAKMLVSLVIGVLVVTVVAPRFPRFLGLVAVAVLCQLVALAIKFLERSLILSCFALLLRSQVMRKMNFPAAACIPKALGFLIAELFLMDVSFPMTVAFMSVGDFLMHVMLLLFMTACGVGLRVLLLCRAVSFLRVVSPRGFQMVVCLLMAVSFMMSVSFLAVVSRATMILRLLMVVGSLASACSLLVLVGLFKMALGFLLVVSLMMAAPFREVACYLMVVRSLTAVIFLVVVIFPAVLCFAFVRAVGFMMGMRVLLVMIGSFLAGSSSLMIVCLLMDVGFMLIMGLRTFVNFLVVVSFARMVVRFLLGAMRVQLALIAGFAMVTSFLLIVSSLMAVSFQRAGRMRDGVKRQLEFAVSTLSSLKAEARGASPQGAEQGLFGDGGAEAGAVVEVLAQRSDASSASAAVEGTEDSTRSSARFGVAPARRRWASGSSPRGAPEVHVRFTLRRLVPRGQQRCRAASAGKGVREETWEASGCASPARRGASPPAVGPARAL